MCVIHKMLSQYFSAMGRKSVKARMRTLSPEQRQEIARNAAKARWAKTRKSKKSEAQGWEETVSDKRRTAIYVRCSTAEQETMMQESELKEYCERRGWEPILYRDRG